MTSLAQPSGEVLRGLRERRERTVETLSVVPGIRCLDDAEPAF